MNYETARNEIAKAEAKIERAKAGYTPNGGEPQPGLVELERRRKKLKADTGRVLLLDKNDVKQRDELKRQLAEVDAEIAAINEEVSSLENLIASHRQYLSDGAKLERKRTGIQGGERVTKRISGDLPKLTDAIQSWLDDGTKLFAEMDEIARANSIDFHELARVALENDDRDSAASDLEHRLQRSIHLNIDAVLSGWLNSVPRFARNECVESHISAANAPSVFELLEIHADQLLAVVAQLRSKIEEAQQEEEAPCE